MAIAFGRDVTFAIAKEQTTYNEAWGAPSLVGLYLTAPPVLDVNLDPIKEPRLSGRPELLTTDVKSGIKNWTLGIEGKLPKEALGFLLLSLFEKVTTPSPSVGFFTHTFVPAATTTAVTSLKVQIRNPMTANDTEWRLRGGKVKTLKLTLNQNESVKFSADLVGGAWNRHTTVTGAPSIPVPSIVNPFYDWKDTPVCTIATVNFPIFSAEIVYENVLADSLTDSYEYGSIERVRLVRAGDEDVFRVKGTLKSVWQSITAQAAYEQFTDKTIVISFLDPNSFYSINNTFLYSRIIKANQSARGFGLFEETVEFESYGSGTESDISCVYKDKQAEPVTQ